MSSTSAGRRLSLRRAAVIGFAVGVVVTLPAVFLALLVPFGEQLLPVLVPGSMLLQPLAPAMSTWPGAVNVLLTAVINGLVYAIVFAGISFLISRRRGAGR